MFNNQQVKLVFAESFPKKDVNEELMTFDDDGEGWEDQDADWGDLEDGKYCLS
jgi:hypothetical protein